MKMGNGKMAGKKEGNGTQENNAWRMEEAAEIGK